MLLLVFSSAVVPAPARQPGLQAVATVRVEGSATASRDEWERRPKPLRREIIVRDKMGRVVVLRMIEYE